MWENTDQKIFEYGHFSRSLLLRKKTEFKRNNVQTVYNGSETLTFLGLELGKLCHTTLKK